MNEMEFPTVNRAVMVILMKQPYVDWANELPDRHELEKKSPHTLNEINKDSTAYLIPEIFDDEELELYLERAWILLFEMQLSGWTSDERLWPKKRTIKMFNEWFEVKCHSLVYDLWGKEPLGYTEY